MKMWSRGLGTSPSSPSGMGRLKPGCGFRYHCAAVCLGKRNLWKMVALCLNDVTLLWYFKDTAGDVSKGKWDCLR